MSIIWLFVGFAIAVLVMPPAVVEKAQRTVRSVIAGLVQRVQDQTDDKDKKSDDDKERR